MSSAETREGVTSIKDTPTALDEKALDSGARKAAMEEYRLTLKTLQARQGIPPADVEDMAVGCALVAYLSHVEAARPQVTEALVAEAREWIRNTSSRKQFADTIMHGLLGVIDRQSRDLAALRREIDEALVTTESVSTLKDMAAACVEGAMWKDRAETAERDLAAAKRSAEGVRNAALEEAAVIVDHWLGDKAAVAGIRALKVAAPAPADAPLPAQSGERIGQHSSTLAAAAEFLTSGGALHRVRVNDKMMTRADVAASLLKIHGASPDWFYCTVDPDESGDSAYEAMFYHRPRLEPVELGTSFIGPRLWGVMSPPLPDAEDDGDTAHTFETKEAAEAFSAERRAMLSASPSPSSGSGQ